MRLEVGDCPHYIVRVDKTCWDGGRELPRHVSTQEKSVSDPQSIHVGLHNRESSRDVGSGEARKHSDTPQDVAWKLRAV